MSLRRFLELLGSVHTASTCHSKMLLMAAMLNHHSEDLGVSDTVLMAHVKTLGRALDQVCKKPACWFHRMSFMVAYSRYACKFLDWKAADTDRLVEGQLAELERNFQFMTEIKKLVKNGKLPQENGHALVAHYRMKSKQNFLQCSRLLGASGGSKRAKYLAQRRLTRSLFLKDLAKTMKESNFKLEYTQWVYADSSSSSTSSSTSSSSSDTDIVEDFSSADRSRMACAHYMLQGRIDPPMFGTRDYCGQIGEKLFSKWYGADFVEWKSLKNCITRLSSRLCQTQNEWLPPLLNFATRVVKKICSIKSCKSVPSSPSPSSPETDLDYDFEFIWEQSCLNNCDAINYIKHLMSCMRSVGCTHPGLTHVTTLVDSEGITKPTLDYFTDIMACACANISKCELTNLVDTARKVRPLCENELLAVVDELIKHPSQFDAVCDSVYAAKKHQDVTTDRQTLLGLQFVDVLCASRDSVLTGLTSLPPTLGQFSLDILRLQLDISQVVSMFCIIYYLIGVSQNDSWVYTMKKRVKEALALASIDQQLDRLFQVADEARPQMDFSEQNIVRGLIRRLVEHGEYGPVGGLALSRIRTALSQAICPSAMAPPMAENHHFACEMNDIVSKAMAIWNCSLATYEPVYSCITRARWLWEAPSNLFD